MFWRVLLSGCVLLVIGCEPQAKQIERGAKEISKVSGESCVAHLKQIDGAKATWALENAKKPDDVPLDSDLFGENSYIRSKPRCPAGGTYILGKVREKPRCTKPEHVLP